MGISAFMIMGLCASAIEGIWQGCQNAWGANPVKGYRIERRLDALDREMTELTRDMSDEDYFLSAEVEELSRRHDALIIALFHNKGLDPFEGGPAQMYWSGRERTRKRREELLNPRPPTTAQEVADALYARLHPEFRAPELPAVSSAHRLAIGMSQRLALPPAN
jgi:hypothetical protein